MDGFGTLESAATDIAVSLERLGGRLGSEDAVREFVRNELGIDAPDALSALGVDPGLLTAVTQALGDLADELAKDEPDTTTIAALAVLVAAAVAAAAGGIAQAGQHAAAGLDPAFLQASKLVEELPVRTLDWVVVKLLEDSVPRLLELLRVLTVATVERVAEDPATFTTEHTARTLDLDPLTVVFSDPTAWLRQSYGWGTATPALRVLLQRLWELALTMGLPASFAPEQLEVAQVLHGAPLDPEADTGPWTLRVPLLHPATSGFSVEAGLALVELPPRDGLLAGLALMPYADGALQESFPLDTARDWQLAIGAGLDLQGGFAVIARPGQPLRLLADVASGSGAEATGELDVTLSRLATAPEIGLVTFGASGLFVTGAHLRVAGLLSSAQSPELLAEIGLDKAHLRVATDPNDGFLRTVTSNIDVPFDAGFGFSTRRGAYFVGGAGLGLDIPLGLRVGPVEFQQLRAKLAPQASSQSQAAGGRVDLGLDLGFALGPFAAALSGIGARLELEQKAGGNLGPVDLGVGLMPPTGVGLAIATPVVSGGGFLSLDPDTGLYAGVFELTLLGTVSVKAIGLINTKDAQGRPSFALLIIITAEGFTPIQLGFGFELTGIGGLLALNHTVNADAVKDGLRDGVLDQVLFVSDPIHNAAKIITTLERVFPQSPDRLLIGPLVEIGWGGSPPLVKIRMALLLELPKPVRVVLLAALSAYLPKPGAAVVELHVDAIGVLDLSRGELSLDASLHDSRILTYPLAGDMALLCNWGDAPIFVLSCGGFHPRYQAPSRLRQLNRLSLTLASGVPSVRLEAYLAITSNSIQFGARLTLSASIAGFGVNGGGAFDALVQWSPFFIDLDLQAWVKITAGGETLFSASINAELSGPTPWHVTGTASISLLFWSVDVHIDFTFGDSVAPPPADTVDVAGLIFAELETPSSWQASLPAGLTPGATLAAPAAAAGAPFVVHPRAQLSVRQKAAPLDTPISRVGARLPAAGTRSYTLAVTAPAGYTTSAVTDKFAPAQYSDLSDDAKLSGAAFADFHAGVTIAPQNPSAVPTAGLADTDLMYETLDLTSLDEPPVTGQPVAAQAASALPRRGPLSASTPGLARSQLVRA